MHKCNLPVSMLDAKQAKEACPYLNIPDNFVAAVEEDAGILAASKAVAALQVNFSRLAYQVRLVIIISKIHNTLFMLCI